MTIPMLATARLETTSCCVCGTKFAVDEVIMENRRKNAGGIWCPNGHKIGWNESEADRLRKMLEEANRSKTELVEANRRAWDAAAEAEKALKKEKAAAKRASKRVHAGVCPCCNRTFQNLARHMATKHKDEKP